MYHAIALVAALTYKCAYASSSVGCTTDTAVTQTGKRSGNLSFCVGGRTASDRAEWTPNIGVVRTAIQFVISTQRLVMDIDE
jgi:hypothetical protein